MCTVTYLPTQNGYLLTSNRDEKFNRGKALPPLKYGRLVYPKDPDKLGTWIVHSKNNITLCLLNGARTKHATGKVYIKSRGLIVLDIAKAENPFEFIKQIDLNGIEPFTLVIANGLRLCELVWNEQVKEINFLNASSPAIWSSATLYNQTMRQERQEWFSNWLANNKDYTQQDVLDFHLNTKKENKDYGLFMNRNNEVFTISVTNIVVKDNEFIMQYYDAIDGATTIFEDYEMNEVNSKNTSIAN